MIHKKTFTNELLNSNYQFEYSHNLNTTEILVKWYDNNGIERSTFDLLQIIDEYKIILSCNEEIEGTHTLLFSYEMSGATTLGRRLFELDGTEDPDTSLRLALGKANTQSVNIKLSSFLTWLFSKLGFLKIKNNLYELKGAAESAKARSNLGVYSTTQVNGYLAQKATLFQSGSGQALGVNNTSPYNPSGDYNPATLKTVKNVGFKLILAGYVGIDGSPLAYFRNTDILTANFTATKTATGSYTVTHNLGKTNYYVLAITIGTTDPGVSIQKLQKYDKSFQVYTADDSSTNNSAFEFFMFQLNSYIK